ncbi:AAA family ATPase [Salipiger pacificus]|nr:AAA family ATPase [Alloyangia pacifica]
MVALGQKYAGGFTPSKETPAYDEPHDLAFANELSSFGLVLKGPVLSDGEIHRIPTRDDKRGDLSGWYVFHEGDAVSFGAYGDWRLGGSTKWSSKGEAVLSFADRSEMERKLKEAEARAAARQAEAAERSSREWDDAADADPMHPYLVAKGITAHGIRQNGDKLIVPGYGPDGSVIMYQAIGPDGTKRFVKGAAKQGSHYWIEGDLKDVVFVAEGFATAATIREVTGRSCVVAWDAGNLPTVAAIVRQQTDAKMVIAADMDQWKPDKGNAGLRKAREAADAAGNAIVAVPQFALIGNRPTDWNDLAQNEGLDVVRDQLSKVVPQLADDVEPITLGGFDPLMLAQIKPREWVYGRHLIRKFVSLTLADGGVGKTNLVLIDAVAMALNKPLLYDAPQAGRRLKVAHYNLEDPLEELYRRVWAICCHYKISPMVLKDHLFLNSGRDRRLLVARADRVNGFIVEPDAKALEREIREKGIDVLSIDPFVKVHSVNENDNGEIDRVASIFADIAHRTGCAIELVHHAAKGKAGSGQSAARGASSLAGAVRSARELVSMSRDEADHLGVDMKEYPYLVRLADGAKQNLAPPGSNTNWLKRIGVDLPNGDQVGTLERWKAPGLFDEVDVEKAKEVWRALRVPEGMDPVWKGDTRSRESWVGYKLAEILGKDWEEDQGWLLKVQKAWEKTGVLKRVQHLDRHRKPRDYIVAGDEPF